MRKRRSAIAPVMAALGESTISDSRIMKLKIFSQALQILSYREVEGWGDTAYEYKLCSAFLIAMAVTLLFGADNNVPNFNESDKRSGVIVGVLDGGRYSRQSLALDEGGEINQYSAIGFTDEELEPLMGREATISTYEANAFLWFKMSSVLGVEIDGQPVLDRSREVQRNTSRFSGGFSFFAKGLLLVQLCLYLSLVHKLYMRKIIIRGNAFIWAQSEVAK